MEKKLLFALDIGTRSVVGLVGEQDDSTIRLIASERKEHHTRAMLDGQIHDVTEVANVLSDIKSTLEETCGPLKEVAVAAAGRALCTLRSTAEIEVFGMLTADDERSLELAAVQSAQQQLATSNAVADPTLYYCVGYSIIDFTLDGTKIKSLIGQKGRLAKINIIATFLPRQVIDSIQSALQKTGLEMAALTLEPIAAINVLIPPTMRHLNLVLVDVGAGTSDVAITRDNTVIGYGMVPFAGDEITEAISQKYLLDFNVAEQVKRQLSGNENGNVIFTDVLGFEQSVSAKELIDNIVPNVGELANAIAGQILTLNQGTPQAVLLVGGGSLTPRLPEALAQSLDIPSSRVAIRRPDTIDGIEGIPQELRTPDSVTPLGILKLARSRTLNFVNVKLNDRKIDLFNLGHLTIADALLAAGIDIRSLHGKPGLGITLKINGKTKFIAGTVGTPGIIELNGNKATFDMKLNEDDEIIVIRGVDGTVPSVKISDVLNIPSAYPVTINGVNHMVKSIITVNSEPVSGDITLNDRDEILCSAPLTLEEVLKASGIPSRSRDYTYIINGSERTYSVWPTFIVNGTAVSNSAKVSANDKIVIKPPTEPTVSEVLGLSDDDQETITILFNNNKVQIPTRRYSISVNDKPACILDSAPNNSNIVFTCSDRHNPMISDILLAVEFNPREIPSTSKIQILLNGRPTEYTAITKNGDSVDIVISQ
ncbi:cell division FtsA domain-containing protein [Dendrosporobacter sp. 1207_IL3150]|uniref:cell division FtsA domain-containing protein n=1 Tax=Dendrosporobacter sp. 1207_IL3150 TaxID=3084054 RepID=UPI002FD8F9B1